MKKALSLLLLTTLLSAGTAFPAVVATPAFASKEIGKSNLAFSSKKGFAISEVENFLKDSDLHPQEFRGKVNLNGEEVTFGVLLNPSEETGLDMLLKIEETLEELMISVLKTESVSREVLEEYKKKVLVTMLTFEDNDEIIAQKNKLITNQFMSLMTKDKDIKYGRVSKVQEGNILDELKKRKQSSSKEFEAPYSNIKLVTPSIEDRELYLAKHNNNSTKVANESDGMQLPSFGIESSSLGGPNLNTQTCDPYVTNPYCGDGQDRLKQKTRFNGTGIEYNWLPYFVKSEVKTTDSTGYYRQVRLDFKWDAAGLSNLVIDSNEAVEAEVNFYNYGPSGLPAGLNGYAYMASDPQNMSWYTNVPSAYLDTRFADSSYEKSYAMGTAYPSQLVAGNNYYFIMNGVPSATNSNNGLYLIDFQRGYWHNSKNAAYVSYRTANGNGDEWYVFNEEQESYGIIKQYHKYNSKYYAPGTFSEFTTTGYVNQWRYKQSFPLVSSGSSVDTGSIPVNGYTIYKLQVSTPSNYKIKLYQNSSAYDPAMHLYNHDFSQVEYNDDFNGSLYPEINRYLTPGDYYIQVRGYNYAAMRANLSVTTY